MSKITGKPHFKSCLYALDADTGDPRWRIRIAEDLWGRVSTVAVDGSTVYFGTENGAFYAADTTRGELRWKYRTQSDGAGWTDPPLATDGVVYGSVKNKPPTEEGPGRTYAFDADSGTQLWIYDTTYSASPLNLPGGAVHFSDINGSLHTLDPRTGMSLGTPDWPTALTRAWPSPATAPTSTAATAAYTRGGSL
ncbi:PQQ-binding-like beta-propeller repeat protein [Streptomyces sp. NPDC094034]|uniref:outer membrane protein assembly factor BamB family protein n=1 Tax=Streptomyces sp. NPDC094034 TaxID=3155309 RepID=UPI003322E3A9